MSEAQYGSDEWLRLVVRRVGVVAVGVTVESLALAVIGTHALWGWPW